MSPNNATLDPFRLASAARRPSQIHDVQTGFESVHLDSDMAETTRERGKQRQEDAEYVHDCPEDAGYEANRQRYLASRIPVNKTERALQLLTKTPGYITQTAAAASQTAASTMNSVSQHYDQGGAMGIARTALTSSVNIAKELAESLTESSRPAMPEMQRLERKTRDGRTYTIPSRQEIMERGAKKPLRDLSVGNEEEEEEWEEDEEMEGMAAARRGRWG